jgi:hypothetical protein
MNGGDLFWITLYMRKTQRRIPYRCLSLYGVPDPCDPRQIEPINIRYEDFRSRPSDTPKHMLKFASFYVSGNSRTLYDLFVDTQTQVVHSAVHDAKNWEVINSWDSIDDCLCDVFDLLSASYLKE